MIFNNLVFHIHHCNSQKYNELKNIRTVIRRTLQHHELLLITSGKGQVTYNNKKYPLKKGMLCYISPDNEHSIKIDTKDPICFMSVHFDYTSVNHKYGKWEFENYPGILPLSTSIELNDYYQIESSFSELVKTWYSKIPGYEFLSKTDFQRLLIVIYYSSKRHKKNSEHSVKVEKIITYMNKNIDKKLGLLDFSEYVQLSQFHMSRIFKNATGYSVIRFFNKLKMDKAKELLIEGENKIKEISTFLGFTDEFYFSRIFKKIEGISPSEYSSKNVHGV